MAERSGASAVPQIAPPQITRPSKPAGSSVSIDRCAETSRPPMDVTEAPSKVATSISTPR
ncbi:hypothetical protein D9M69_713180 [compost metagenome]